MSRFVTDNEAGLAQGKSDKPDEAMVRRGILGSMSVCTKYLIRASYDEDYVEVGDIKYQIEIFFSFKVKGVCLEYLYVQNISYGEDCVSGV